RACRGSHPPLLSGAAAPLHPPSFPTRRSSDLETARLVQDAAFSAHADASGAADGPGAAPSGGAWAHAPAVVGRLSVDAFVAVIPDRKSTRLNSSHVKSSYAVFCLKNKHETFLH